MELEAAGRTIIPLFRESVVDYLYSGQVFITVLSRDGLCTLILCIIK